LSSVKNLSVGTKEHEYDAYKQARPLLSEGLVRALNDRYGIDANDATDLGGSMNLNLLVRRGEDHLVARVYMPYVTPDRLSDIQRVRREVAARGIPCPAAIPTNDGAPWTTLGDSLIEVEPFVGRDANMDSWERIETGLPLLGRIHTLLRPIDVSPDGQAPPVANHVEARDALPWTLLGTERIRSWNPTVEELALTEAAEDLANLLDVAQRPIARSLPRQLVHGDFWDNNVFFRDGRVVLVADFDFMGIRDRIDDLALTLYYTNSTFTDDQLSGRRIRRLRRLVDAYDTGLDDRLTSAERRALPLALARTPLYFVGLVGALKTEQHARRLAAEMRRDIQWALGLMRDVDRWQTAFATSS
jgi:Ser/Thr protein kinase RdoA (MazF antagonist)